MVDVGPKQAVIQRHGRTPEHRRTSRVGKGCTAFVLLVTALCQCQTAPPPPLAAITPERQFNLTDFDLEERRNGAVGWRGHAAASQGDMQVSDVQGIVLTRPAQNAGERQVTVRADTAHLAFDAGKATFRPVWVEDGAQGTLHGSEADYDAQRGTLQATGPIRFDTPNGHLTAQAATLELARGPLILEGPVSGTLLPQAHP